MNIPSTTPPNPLSTLLDVGDSVTDLKQSLKGASGILDETTDVAKGVALELVDRSLETMEEGNPTGNKPSGNNPTGNKSKGSE